MQSCPLTFGAYSVLHIFIFVCRCLCMYLCVRMCARYLYDFLSRAQFVGLGILVDSWRVFAHNQTQFFQCCLCLCGNPSSDSLSVGFATLGFKIHSSASPSLSLSLDQHDTIFGRVLQLRGGGGNPGEGSRWSPGGGG